MLGPESRNAPDLAASGWSTKQVVIVCSVAAMTVLGLTFVINRTFPTTVAVLYPVDNIVQKGNGASNRAPNMLGGSAPASDAIGVRQRLWTFGVPPPQGTDDYAIPFADGDRFICAADLLKVTLKSPFPFAALFR
jgi:hypothetical protein